MKTLDCQVSEACRRRFRAQVKSGQLSGSVGFGGGGDGRSSSPGSPFA